MKSERRYDDLLEKFFDGSTDNREERIIYEMFRSGGYPPHWAPYADLFAHFERGLSDEDFASLCRTEAAAAAESVDTYRRRSVGHRLCGAMFVRRAVAVAAVVAVSLMAVRIASNDPVVYVDEQSPTESDEQRLAEEFRRWEEWVASEYDSFERLKNDDPFNEFINLQL